MLDRKRICVTCGTIIIQIKYALIYGLSASRGDQFDRHFDKLSSAAVMTATAFSSVTYCVCDLLTAAVSNPDYATSNNRVIKQE
jgi:hypothetical protein